jgi:L-serine dehydratase
MRAALCFVEQLVQDGRLERTERLEVELFGSLALTGHGHGTDRGVLLGLMGWRPDTVEPEVIAGLINAVQRSHILDLAGRHRIHFDAAADLIWHREQRLPYHPNGLRFAAYATAKGASRERLDCRTYYSVGGGFFVEEGETQASGERDGVAYPFHSAEDLLRIGREQGLRIDQIMLANELASDARDEEFIEVSLPAVPSVGAVRAATATIRLERGVLLDVPIGADPAWVADLVCRLRSSA